MSEQKSVLVRATSTPPSKDGIGLAAAAVTATIGCIGVLTILSINAMREPEPDVSVGQYGLVRPERQWYLPGHDFVKVKALNPHPTKAYDPGDTCALPDDGSVKVVAVSAERWDVLMEYLGPASRVGKEYPDMWCPIGTLFRTYASQADDMNSNLSIYDFHRERERALVEAYYLSTHLP